MTDITTTREGPPYGGLSSVRAAAQWRENPPVLQSAKLPAFNTAPVDSKPQIQFPLVGRGFPDAPPSTGLRNYAMSGEYVQFISGNVGKLLASFRQQAPENYQKSNANTGNVTDSPKNCANFSDFPPEGHRAPSLQLSMIVCTFSSYPSGRFGASRPARNGCRALRENFKFCVFNWCLRNCGLVIWRFETPGDSHASVRCFSE